MVLCLLSRACLPASLEGPGQEPDRLGMASSLKHSAPPRIPLLPCSCNDRQWGRAGQGRRIGRKKESLFKSELWGDSQDSLVWW